MINELGITGNIDKLEQDIIIHQNRLVRERADTEEAVVALEQEATDAFLNNIEVQQLITELELMIIEGVKNDI